MSQGQSRLKQQDDVSPMIVMWMTPISLIQSHFSLTKWRSRVVYCLSSAWPHKGI